MKTSSHLRITVSGVVLLLITLSCSFLSSTNQENSNPIVPTTTRVLAIMTATPGASVPEAEEVSTQPAPSASTEVPPPTQSPEQQAEAPAAPPEPEAAAAQGPALEQDCSLESCVQSGYFFLTQPVSENARNMVDHSNRFGSYQKRTRDVHHGVDFLNSTGTPVNAAADGTVVVAGDDLTIPYALHTNTYGNLVILQHQLPGVSAPVYTLYGHLSEIHVQNDQVVSAGEQIGLVGMSGGVKGSTLHFEVRFGENLFSTVINPELWLAPLTDEDGQALGALAGRVIDAEGNFLKVENIVLERLAGPGMPAIDQLYLKTYAEKRLLGISPIGETFGVGSLPPGEYQITFLLNGVHQRVVKIEPGQLTLVTFKL